MFKSLAIGFFFFFFFEEKNKDSFLKLEDNDFTMEKEIATHSSILAWKIPWTEEPGRLQSMGSLKVGHD